MAQQNVSQRSPPTRAAIEFHSRLDGSDGGDDGPVWHDGSVYVHFLGGGERGADWQSIVGTAQLLCFYVQQLSERKDKK